MASKKGRPAPKTAFKKGEVHNPTGRPKDEESWAGVMRWFKNLTAEEISTMLGHNNELGRAYAQMPKKVQMKYLMTLRAGAAFMFEPTATIWNTIMDRDEGKVTEHIDHTTKDEKITMIGVVPVDYRVGLADLAPRPISDSDPSGENQDAGDGAQVG